MHKSLHTIEDRIAPNRNRLTLVLILIRLIRKQASTGQIADPDDQDHRKESMEVIR